jgi:V8-like Glu-specific endopeptidase
VTGRNLRNTLLAAAAAGAMSTMAGTAYADEGMWTFDNIPAAAIEKAVGFKPTASWLEKVRLSSVRLAGGCSGSFVSPNGLVMTNHHCIDSCISELSTAQDDLLSNGFLAAKAEEERKCAGIEINQLIEISDVTAEISNATAGKTGAAFNDARRAAQAAAEKACSGGDTAVRCDVVTLYQGGRYNLYKYRRHQDVRLAFAPEYGAAAFGGDPDNFNFPRYALDMGLLRVYGADGKPLSSPNFFPWSKKGSSEGQAAFVTGHPGKTSRLETVAQLASIRDLFAPATAIYLSEKRGRLLEFSRRGEDELRIATDELAGVENSLKVWRGRQQALNDPEFFGGKVAAQDDLRSRIKSDAKLAADVGTAYEDIAATQQIYRSVWPRYAMTEGLRGFDSDLYAYARMLVRAADEAGKPNAERLREYSEARLPGLKQRLSNPAPVHAPLELLTLSFSLEKLRENLSPDDPLVKSILGRQSPLQKAEELIKGSQLGDPAVRLKLLEGGKAAVDASTDPMIVLARLVDPEARALRKRMEEEVDSKIEEAQARIARARFALLGDSTYPDATFSLRLSYGKVQGWTEPDGRPVTPYTTIDGLFARDTGAAPFDTPSKWDAAKGKVKGATPMNLVTTNDIIGGNSGSPLIDKDAQVIGLVFDGNIHSLAGDYGYDGRRNRTVAVDVRGMTEALKSVYGADRLVKELGVK